MYYYFVRNSTFPLVFQLQWIPVVLQLVPSFTDNKVIPHLIKVNVYFLQYRWALDTSSYPAEAYVLSHEIIDGKHWTEAAKPRLTPLVSILDKYKRTSQVHSCR